MKRKGPQTVLVDEAPNDISKGRLSFTDLAPKMDLEIMLTIDFEKPNILGVLISVKGTEDGWVELEVEYPFDPGMLVPEDATVPLRGVALLNSYPSQRKEVLEYTISQAIMDTTAVEFRGVRGSTDESEKVEVVLHHDLPRPVEGGVTIDYERVAHLFHPPGV